MDMGKQQVGHTLTLDTSNDDDLLFTRRRFIVFATLFPLGIGSQKIDANPLGWLAVAAFGYLARNFIKKTVAKTLVKSKVKTFAKQRNLDSAKNGKISVSNASGYKNHGVNMVDLSLLLGKTVWDKNSNNNPASIVIDNTHIDNSVNTGNINVELKDDKNGRIDVAATILPLDIPPKSRLVLDMKFSSLPSSGLKKLDGTYGDGNHNISKSGKILVVSNANIMKENGKTVDELYKEYEKNGLRSKYIRDLSQF